MRMSGSLTFLIGYDQDDDEQMHEMTQEFHADNAQEFIKILNAKVQSAAFLNMYVLDLEASTTHPE